MFVVEVDGSKISLDVSVPDEKAKIVSDDARLLKRLSTSFGLYHTIGEATTAPDLVAGLKDLGKDFTLVHGAEILNQKIAPLAEGEVH